MEGQYPHDGRGDHPTAEKGDRSWFKVASGGLKTGLQPFAQLEPAKRRIWMFSPILPIRESGGL